MPYSDPNEKRTADRQAKQKQREVLKKGRDEHRLDFGSWLSVVAPQIKGQKSWSTELASAMDMGSEYRSSLRKIAKGKTAPRCVRAYEIGEGLRACGLRWCSGLLALKHCDLLACYSVIDIASVDKTIEVEFLRWFILAEERLHYPARRNLRPAMERINDIIAGAVDRAWTKYLRDGTVRKAHGLLGIAAQVRQDANSGPAASHAFTALYLRWRASIDVKDDELLQPILPWVTLSAKPTCSACGQPESLGAQRSRPLY